MPQNVIHTLLGIATIVAATLLGALVIPLAYFMIALHGVAHDAARTYAITGSVQAVVDELNHDLQALNVPTTLNGNTLIAVMQVQAGQSGPGFGVDSTPTSPNATVYIQYNAPLVFDKALTLIGGPVLPVTVPLTAKGTYWNEVQYTGVSP